MLLITGRRSGEGAFVLPPDMLPRLLPRFHRYGLSGFLDDDTIVLANGSIYRLRFGDRQGYSFADHAEKIHLLVASPRHHRMVWAADRDLYFGWPSTPGKAEWRRMYRRLF